MGRLRALSPPAGLAGVGRLRCRITLAGDATGLPRSEAVWGAAAEQALAAADACLAEALAGDPAVYVLRDVRVECLAAANPIAGGEALAEVWGRRLARAALHRIADSDIGNDVDRRHYADQADYVAHFLSDLLDGRAWEQWQYRPFRRQQAATDGETARRVLLDNRAHLPAVLAALRDVGRLDALLRALGPAAGELWRDGPARAPDDREALRPFVATALALADHLNLWAGARPTVDNALAAMPAARPLVDWRDRRGLAEAVLFVLGALAAQGRLRPLSDPLPPPPPDLDWLDGDWLMVELPGRIAGPAPRPAIEPFPTDRLPGRPTPTTPTPRQTQLLADLLGLLGDDPRPDESSAAAALRLYADLTAAHPHWRDDPLVPALLERLLAGRDALLAGRETDMRRDLHPLGPTAEALARRLAATPAAVARQPWDGAGAALLLRSMNDVNLLALARAAHPADPPAAGRALAAGLLLRLANDAPPADPSPPVAALCGIANTPGELSRALAGFDWAALSTAWLDHPFTPDRPAGEAFNLPVAPAPDPSFLELMADDLLRLWARWLGRFAGSSRSYLLLQFVRRGGALLVADGELVVELEARPLDIVLQMAGYFDPLERLPWPDDRRLRFRLKE